MVKRSALVTGAGGAIGATLVRKLMAEGYAVRALVHDQASAAAALPPNVEIISGDITDWKLPAEAVRHMDFVFHLAAKLHLQNPSRALAGEYEKVNVEGTRGLVKAAIAAKCARVVFFSTINVYGPTRPGEVFDDVASLNPDSIYAETKVRAEETVRNMAGGVILRVAAVYGPRMKGNYPRLLDALRRRRPVIVGTGLNRRTLVYVEDLCRAAMLAAEKSAAAGQTYNVSDGSIHTLREIVEAMSAALGQSAPRLQLPKAPLRLVAGAVEDTFHLLRKNPPIDRQSVDKLTEDVAVTCHKIQRELGYQPRYDLRAGWRETVRLLDARG